MLKRIILLTFVLITVSLSAQEFDWNWGKDRGKTESHYNELRNAYYDEKYEDAIEPMQWLFENTPNLNPSLYSYSIDVYDGLANESEDPQQKMSYQDSVLNIYDRQIQHFGDTAENFNFKAYYAFQAFSKNSTRYSKLRKMLEKAIQMNGDSSFSENVTGYAYLLAYQRKENKISEQDFIKHYEELSGIVERNLKAKEEQNEDVEEWIYARSFLEEQLINTIRITCDFIQKHFVPKLRKDPDNLALAENIVQKMILAKCKPDTLFWRLVEKMAQEKPTYERFKILAKAYKNKPKEEIYIQKAIEYAPNKETKAFWYYNLARKAVDKNNKILARTHFLKAAQLDPKRASQAYSFLGYLYFNSAECSKNTNPCLAKAVYIASYKMYQKAGEQSNMLRVKQYFPTPEELHLHNMGGKQVFLDCWIQEYVTLPNLKKK